MEVVKLSLVVATVDRTAELRALFAGFAAQPFRGFEVLLVDQNPDNRLVPLVEEFSQQFPIRHLRSTVRNCSHARNLGLAAAWGMYAGFPDDDCLYPAAAMERVVAQFDGDPDLVLLGGNCVSPAGKLVNGRWTRHSCVIDEKTVWTTIAGYAMWMRTAELREVGGFDAAIGPGTPWGSSEEPDLALRLLRRGWKGYYDVHLGIRHPDNTLTPHAIERAFRYGAGMGRVLRKHSIRARVALPYFIRPVGGMLLSLGRLRLDHFRYYRDTLRGRLFGYLSAPPRPKRVS